MTISSLDFSITHHYYFNIFPHFWLIKYSIRQVGTKLHIPENLGGNIPLVQKIHPITNADKKLASIWTTSKR
jgi:hypothetical protein